MGCLTCVDEFLVNRKKLFLSHQSFGACFISGRGHGRWDWRNSQHGGCRCSLIGQNPIEQLHICHQENLAKTRISSDGVHFRQGHNIFDGILDSILSARLDGGHLDGGTKQRCSKSPSKISLFSLFTAKMMSDHGHLCPKVHLS